MQNTVGIFDSGIGGLTVLSACRRLLPETLFYYLGDNARAPYGSLPPETVTSYAREAMTAFAHLGVSAAVLACNTVTAVCADLLRAEYAFPILGVEPAVLPAARLYHNVLVLCTPRTAESARLRALLVRAGSLGCRATVFAAPKLALAIERAVRFGAPLDLAAHLPQGRFDAVVLGCTHYPFYAREISAFFGAPVFDGSEGTARRLVALLSGSVGEGRDPSQAEVCAPDSDTLQAEVGTSPQNAEVDGEWTKPTKKNVCSGSKWGERRRNGVIFLGSSASDNNFCYKRMFDLP